MLKFTKSLKGRLAVYFALAIVASLLISGFLSVALVQRYLRQKTVSDLKFQAETLSRQVETEGLPQRRYIADLERMYGTKALIIPNPQFEQAITRLPRGGRGDEAETSHQLQLLNWDQLKKGETQVIQAQPPGFDREMIVVAHGFTAGGELAGAVVLAKPVSLLPSWLPIAGWFLLAATGSLAVSLLLAFLLARRLSQPLLKITKAATAVAAGDFSSEIDVHSEDEIGRLADAFRYMSSEVQKSQEQQRQFVINVSHELKTPLTAIAGHTQALREGVAGDPQAVASSLKVIAAETRRLSRLIEDLLNLAKFDARQFELRYDVVSVADIINEVADGFAREASKRGVELTTADSTAFKINIDPDRLRQILSNLIHNALSYTPAGGKVTITSRKSSDHVEIEVSDTGCGIDPEDLPHIFDRFYHTRQVGKDAGLGLGLSISRELAQAMGGDIVASSEPGQGSCFVVILPG